MGLERIRVNGDNRPVRVPIEASVGDVIEIDGWAVDTDTGRGVSAVWARLDKRLTFQGTTGIPCPQLEQKLGTGARDGGFSVRIPTGGLRPSTHRLLFAMSADWTTFDVMLRLTAGNGRPSYYPQILVAAGIKSGNRHVAAVLRAYFGVENPVWSDANDGEHLLTDDLIRPVIERPFIVGLHCLARAINLNAIAHWGFKTVVTWRNLGDVIISLDEHIRWMVDHLDSFRFAPEGIWRGWPFLDARESYARMSDDKRHEFLIRNAIPWYLGFYLSWRLAGEPLMMRYEWMVNEPHAYFRYLIERLDGPADERRLQNVVEAGPTKDSGFNVGVRGRSATLLSEKCQEMLETCICEHPSDLTELLYELPWYAEKHAVPLLVALSNGEVYWLAEGTKRRASEHWLRTHQYDRSALTPASPGDIEGYRSGADLY